MTATDRRVVLVVDDDADIRTTMSLFLELEGYGVLTAANGAEALALVRAGPHPDAILLDLTMPVMDGRRFCAELAKEPGASRIPVVVLSGEDTTKVNAAELGAQGCLKKPIDLGDLLRSLSRVAGPAGRARD